MKNKLFKTLALFLALACLISTSALASTGGEQTPKGKFTDEELECGYTFGNVFVLLKDEYAGYPNYEDLFPELEVTVLKSGTLIPFVLLGIADKTPQGVLDAVELLNKNQCVNVANPNYIGHITETTMPIQGDVNGDGTLSNADLILMAQHVVGIELLDASKLALADANGDGTFSNSDLVAFSREVIGLE